MLAYFQAGGEAGDRFSLSRVGEVVGTAARELRLAVVPDVSLAPWPEWEHAVSVVLVILALGLLVIAIVRIYRRQVPCPPLLVEAATFIVIPLVGFCFLHFNIWYLLGMMPAAVVIVSGLLAALPAWVPLSWQLVALAGLATITLREFVWQDPTRVDTFYRQTLAVWERVQALSEGKNYAIYVYRADIYDFNWQYLYWREAAMAGVPVPVDAGYQPHEDAYLPYKQKIIADLPRQSGDIEYIFYILDNPDPDNVYFQEWRGQNPDFARAEHLETLGTDLQLWRAEASSAARLDFE